MTDCGCREPDEGKMLSDEEVARVRGLLDPQTKVGRVCLRMLDHGEPIGQACSSESIGEREVMAQWHRLTDANGVRSVDGRRPCISVLADAWRRRWSSAQATAWAPVEAPFSAGGGFAGGPFLR